MCHSTQPKEYKFYFQLQRSKNNTELISFQKNECAPISDDALRFFLNNEESKTATILTGDRFLRGRVAIPVSQQYAKLASNFQTQIFVSVLVSDYLGDYFILPFFFNKKEKKVTTQGFNELCEYLVENSDQGISFDEAKALYKDYIAWVNDTLMKDNETWKTIYHP